MSNREWTYDQKQAINACFINDEKTKRGNILVQAAAGSGKTAVLVERIIKKLIPDEGYEPIDINRLLVVTFTNAAAGEMQERISKALSKELTQAIKEADFKKQKHLKRQLSLLSSADITTIDAFCLKTIRNWFHLLDIDPDFSIMDSGELELLKDDAMEVLFERLYEEEDPRFIDLVCMYTDGRDDKALSDKIKDIYSFIQSFPDPEAWLYEKRDMFLAGEDNFWIKDAVKNAKNCAKKGLKYLGDALDIIVKSSLGEYEDLEGTIKAFPPCEENDIYLAWGSYYTAVYNEYFNMKKILDAGWDGIYEISKEPYIDLRKKADFIDKSKQITDKELKERVKNLRSMARDDAMRSGFLKYISAPFGEVKATLEDKLFGTVSALVDVTVKFTEVYKALKNEKNVMEFSDIEHLCLELFRRYPEVREEYKGRFLEILMDEYQDSNRLQEEIFKSISTGDNIFMVGDMKQSIYRFRSSDPTIFKEKSDFYTKDEHSENRKIVLGKNFRSREMVLDSINDVFELVMTEASGGMDYDEDQRLNAGDMTYAETGCDYRSECIIIEEKGENDENILSKARLEARVIASRIRELKESGFLVRDRESVSIADPKSGEIKKQTKTIYREIKNKDIVILMSSYKGVSDIYMEELSGAGIECYAENDGYFERNEIKLVMSLLKIIGNPYQDIPLLGVMRSPIGGFTDDDLVNIRLSGDGYIYSAAKALAEDFLRGKISDEETRGTAKKVQEFLEKLNRWRGYMTYMTSDKLLWTLYEETDIYSFVGALYGEEESQSNLRLLFERAKKYEKTGYKGLFNFVRYISLLKKKSEDLSSAPVFTENHDVVRIMTIHKSKGLEFPIVFLAGCGKRFNLRDTSGDLILHKDAGFGLDYIDFEKSIKVLNITKTITAGIIKHESIAEEIRKLYVALTRAKEKLIVTATVSGRKEDGSGGTDILEEKWRDIESFNTSMQLKFIDWVAPAAIKSPENWKYTSLRYRDAVKGADITQMEEEEVRRSGIDIDRFMNYEYSYSNVSDIPSKVAVSELKQTGEADTLVYTGMQPMPEFMSPAEGIKGAKKGTLIHYIMQKIPFKNVMDLKYVEEFIEALKVKGIFNEEEADAIEAKKISEFYNSPLGMRMRNSSEIFRERPFEIEISAKEISDGYPEDEQVILQGIIDCYFCEDGEYVLVDYKSDYYENTEDMKKKYKTQLELYSQAIEKITKKKVKNKYLYLFYKNDVVEL